MSNSTQNSFISLLLFGSVFIFVGAFIFLIAIDVFHMPDEGFNAPRWVIAAAGAAFALAGALVILNGLKSGFGDDILFKWAYNFTFLAFMVLFAAPFNWVAFGSGERSFSSSTSVGAVSVTQSGGGEIGGRFAFSLGAILIDLLFLFMIYRIFQGKDLSKAQ